MISRHIHIGDYLKHSGCIVCSTESVTPENPTVRIFKDNRYMEVNRLDLHELSDSECAAMYYYGILSIPESLNGYGDLDREKIKNKLEEILEDIA